MTSHFTQSNTDALLGRSDAGQTALSAGCQRASGNGVKSPEQNGFTYRTNGISIDVTPPGRVVRRFPPADLTINIAPSGIVGSSSCCRVNGKKIFQKQGATGVMDVFAYGQSTEIDCFNHDWGCILQIDRHRLDAVASKSLDVEQLTVREHTRCIDTTAGLLGRIAIDHLRFDHMPDAIFLEGLSIALTARVFALAGADTGLAPSMPRLDPRLRRAVDYIEDNIGTSLSVAECARVAAMSPTWFARSFKAANGIAVHAYVRERRLQRAMGMLDHSRISLTHIAHECGFADQSHLTRNFSKRFGMPPNAWRNR
ncbi:AraC family transcriptional regulator [uncultured Sulfitobacter sp.]|uniref:helix-turn-helix domain-containing protein n=1 Tax=uncultured Sulfitobacter sp. TaxID=191468 RepID=UPI002622D4C8|nr:AraC family transcriptional regulator [uncultured Sulfitobacter sp.]